MGNPCANWGEPRTNHYPQLQGRQKSRISWWHQRQWWVNITASSSKCSSGWLILKNYSDLPPPFGIIGDANQTNLPLNVTNDSQHVITNLVANYKLFSTYSYNLPLVTQLMLRMSTRTWGIFLCQDAGMPITVDARGWFYSKPPTRRSLFILFDMSLKHDLQVVGKAMQIM